MVFDFFPIAGWRPFYHEFSEMWMLSPMSFVDVHWKAVIDRATGHVFQRNGWGFNSHSFSLAGFADELSCIERDRRAAAIAAAAAAETSGEVH